MEKLFKGGRPVKVKYKTRKGEVESVGVFHQWGIRQAKDSIGAPKQNIFGETVGVCELADGSIKILRPEKITFTDRKGEVKQTPVVQQEN